MSDLSISVPVTWKRLEGQGMIGIRAGFAEPPAAKTVAKAIAKATGVPVPEIRRIEAKDDRRLAWMSPDELLLFLPQSEVPATLAALEEGLAERHHLAVDLSEARAVFRLEGPGAREALAKGAPVDMSRAAFGPGDFRRSRLGTIAAAFGQLGEDPEVFDLICFRSVGAHVSAWLDLATAPGSMPGAL